MILWSTLNKWNLSFTGSTICTAGSGLSQPRAAVLIQRTVLWISFIICIHCTHRLCGARCSLARPNPDRCLLWTVPLSIYSVCVLLRLSENFLGGSSSESCAGQSALQLCLHEPSVLKPSIHEPPVRSYCSLLRLPDGVPPVDF